MMSQEDVAALSERMKHLLAHPEHSEPGDLPLLQSRRYALQSQIMMTQKDLHKLDLCIARAMTKRQDQQDHYRVNFRYKYQD
jgi:hypothetical protein